MITKPVVIGLDRTVFKETHIQIVDCASCGIEFGLGADFIERRRDDHGDFSCPNGHTLHFGGRSELEKDRDRLQRLYESANARADAWKDQAEAAEHRRRGQKAANTRLRKRIAAGVCIECHRTFQNLQRHMASQHPDYSVED